MIKRVAALLLCFVMLVALPASAFASQTDDNTPAPASVKYIFSGNIYFGTAVLYDTAGNELPLEFAYSPRVTMSQSIADQLTEMLRECGFALPAVQFDYQMMNMQSFFVVRVTDGQALAKIIDTMVSAPAEEDDDAPMLSGSDAASAENVSPSDVSASDAAAAPSGSDTVTEAPDAPSGEENNVQNITTSLHSLLFGAASFEAYSTLEESFAKAFPEFTFQKPAASALPQSLNSVSGIAVEPDGMSAQVTVMPEPEYVEREVFGEVFQVLMVSSSAYRYELCCFSIAGGTDGAVIPEMQIPVTSPSDTPDATTEETTTTTTAESTTTTAATTTSTTEGASTTTEATTTTTTTAAPVSDDDGYPCSGVVSTKWKRLNVRSGPGLGYKVIDQLDKGEKVTVLELDDGWYKVELSNGTTGWCTSEYITLK